MPNHKSNNKIAEIWEQIRTLFLYELENVPDTHHNSSFLQNLLIQYKPLNPHISISVIFVALKTLESLWGSNNTHGVSFDQILNFDFDSAERIEKNRIFPRIEIYHIIFEEILNYALILPFTTISQAFSVCETYNEFKLFIKKHFQSQTLQLKGRYYTPLAISQFIVHQTLQNIELTEKNRILDLCAGTGSFSIQICQKLYQIYTEKSLNLTPLEIKKRIVKHHLRTVDIDPIATYILRIQILLWYFESAPTSSQAQEFLANLLKVTIIGNILEGPEFLTKNSTT